MRLFAITLISSLLTAGPLSASADDQQDFDASTRDVRGTPADNLCFGGLEDGKIIVEERFLDSPFRQTTRLGCEVDGGDPAHMPDLPRPDDAERRLA